MSHCDKYMEMASLYVDGELSEDDLPELLTHLESCAECRRYYEAYKAVSGALDETPAPEGFAASVMSGVRASVGQKKTETEKKPRGFRRRPAIARYAALAACLALVIAAGVKLASPAGDGRTNGESSPAGFSITAADSNSAQPQAQYDGAQTGGATSKPADKSAKPASAGSSCDRDIDAIFVESGLEDGRLLDEEGIDRALALLHFGGEELDEAPERDADYTMSVDGGAGLSTLQVWLEDGRVICQLDGDKTWVAVGTEDELAELLD